jgi:hypothetical protein
MILFSKKQFSSLQQMELLGIFNTVLFIETITKWLIKKEEKILVKINWRGSKLRELIISLCVFLLYKVLCHSKGYI